MNALTRAAWEFKRELAIAVLKEEQGFKKLGAKGRAAARLGIHRNMMTYLLGNEIKEIINECHSVPSADEVRSLCWRPQPGTAQMSRLRKANESVPHASDESQEVRLHLRANDRKVRFYL